MISDYNPIKLENFRGMYDRGQNDATPPDHAVLSRNLTFISKGFKTRPGLVVHFTEPGVVLRFHVVKLGNVDRLLILYAPGVIVDSLTNTTILTKTGLTDFNCITFLNRVYITLHDGVKGLANEFVYVYTGTGVATKVGGIAPSSIVFTAVDGNPTGFTFFVDAGVHKLAVVYETSTGFIGSPGPVDGFGNFTPVSYTAPGDKPILLDNFDPVDPSVRWLHILATKAGLEEFFFVPEAAGGKILNIPIFPVGSFQVNFTDDMLVDSADYLFDVLTQVPAGVGFARYSGRLVVYGFPDPDGSLARMSLVGQPETFSAVDGFIEVDKDNLRTIQGAFDLRGILYFIKQLGIYAITDNNLEPAEWGAPIVIDTGVGTTVYGTAAVLDESGNTTDRVLIADRSGLLLFDGVARRPAISWKIQDRWDEVSNANRKLMQIAIDPIKQAIYVSAPINSSTPNIIFMGDYTDGIDFNSIRWSMWDVPNRTFKSIGLSNLGEDLYSFKVADSFTILRFDPLITTDIGADLPSSNHSGLLSPDDMIGGVNYFGPLRLRAMGTGLLDCFLTGEPEAGGTISHYAPIQLTPLPGKEYFERTILQSEKAVLSITCPSGVMEVYKAVLFTRTLWGVRPST